MKSVHDAEYRCDAAQQTHARKDSDELHLTPAAKLKVMVQRRHFEQALAVCRLEVADLQNIGKRLADVNKADRDQHERHIIGKGQRRHRTAEPGCPDSTDQLVRSI